MMQDRHYRITALMTGKAREFGERTRSAIAKRPVAGPVAIGRLGLAGDEQVEDAHGGPHMAVHLYPLAHHDYWRGAIGAHPLLDDPGAFGSNVAVDGLTERDVHIGDRFRLGTAQLEISQPRKPCWKIDSRFDRPGMVDAIIETGRCGWYFRVIEEGAAQAGDLLTRDERGDTEWTIAHAFDAIWARAKAFDAAAIRSLSECPALTPKIAEKLRGRVSKHASFRT